MARTDSEFEITIDRLGARGDGIADTADGPLYVPLALPGELVLVRPGAARGHGRAAQLLKVLEPAETRIVPPCRHFGECGGCSAQHLAEAAYLDWKRDIVVTALEHQRLDGSVVDPVAPTPPAGRRRAELAAIRLRGRHGATLLGFHARASHKIVDMTECVILRPALLALIEPLRDVLAQVLEPGGGCDVLLTETPVGIDLLVTAKAPPRIKQTQALAAFAEASKLARVSWASARAGVEPVAQRVPPAVEIDGVAVALPPGAFLQASAEAERSMAALVIENLGKLPPRGRVADLYAGLGTFTLPIAARRARVHAVDSAGEGLNALLAATGAAGLGGRVSVEARDLSERPLMAAELSGYHAVVFDPPRAGAAEVVRQLAASNVLRVVAVSCNPATFARDAATLVDGGYRLARVTPVDQFVYTGHVELVAGFER
ncbi:MAG: class I SAM-dependent RNA methyltransferase [Alphaproteobacteria bacterium]|nr:class I SAM-dependent RNA methyltransferase [Alphaproteobacteria bacterium]